MRNTISPWAWLRKERGFHLEVFREQKYWSWFLMDLQPVDWQGWLRIVVTEQAKLRANQSAEMGKRGEKQGSASPAEWNWAPLSGSWNDTACQVSWGEVGDAEFWVLFFALWELTAGCKEGNDVIRARFWWLGCYPQAGGIQRRERLQERKSMRHRLCAGLCELTARLCSGLYPQGVAFISILSVWK